MRLRSAPRNRAHGLTPRCNNAKRDFLPAGSHVERWAARFSEPAPARRLAEIAHERRWERHPRPTLAVARALQGRLPDDVRLWRRQGDFRTVGEDRSELTRALAR